ncbi:MAG: hypothetical protein ACKPJO_29330 [Dolichospermum sp.]
MMGANFNIFKSLYFSHIKFHYRRFDDYTIDDVRLLGRALRSPCVVCVALYLARVMELNEALQAPQNREEQGWYSRMEEDR